MKHFYGHFSELDSIEYWILSTKRYPASTETSLSSLEIVMMELKI